MGGASPSNARPLLMAGGNAQGAPEELELRWREASGLTDPKERLLGEFSCTHHGDLFVQQVASSNSGVVVVVVVGAPESLCVPQVPALLPRCKRVHFAGACRARCTSAPRTCSSWHPAKSW